MLRGVSILVADDSSTARLFVKKILAEQFNCKNIILAKTGDEAWRIIQSETRIDWIISDWEMPGLSGDELLYKIRCNPKTAELPFIMMTGRNDRDSLITAAQAGVSDFVVKPFSASLLMAKMRKIYLSCERRLKERFKATGIIPVNMLFEGEKKFSASLVNISAGGFLVNRLSNFKSACGLRIYDTVEIDILSDFGHIRLKGELIRIERDCEAPESDQSILTAFEFREIDADNKARLNKLMDNLKSRLPDKVE